MTVEQKIGQALDVLEQLSYGMEPADPELARLNRVKDSLNVILKMLPPADAAPPAAPPAKPPLVAPGPARPGR